MTQYTIKRVQVHEMTPQFVSQGMRVADIIRVIGERNLKDLSESKNPSHLLNHTMSL